MNEIDHHDSDGFRPGDDAAPPPELRRIASLLDDEGAFERATLSEDALERMIAASDLQLPVTVGAGRAVIARIGPSPLGRALRIAAAVAVSAAVVLVAIAAWRGGADEADAVPGGLLVDGGGAAGPGAGGSVGPDGSGVGAPTDAARPSVSHFERALVVARPEAGSVREAVVAAIAVPTRGGDGVLAGAPTAVAVALLDGAEASAGASHGALEFSGLDLTGLEGEMASILGSTPGWR